jgi:hypothetical protein
MPSYQSLALEELALSPLNRQMTVLHVSKDRFR